MLITYLFSTLLSCFGRSNSKKTPGSRSSCTALLWFSSTSFCAQLPSAVWFRSLIWLRADATNGFCDVYILLAQSNPSWHVVFVTYFMKCALLLIGPLVQLVNYSWPIGACMLETCVNFLRLSGWTDYTLLGPSVHLTLKNGQPRTKVYFIDYGPQTYLAKF